MSYNYGVMKPIVTAFITVIVMYVDVIELL
jgi:hypothetical protein